MALAVQLFCESMAFLGTYFLIRYLRCRSEKHHKAKVDGSKVSRIVQPGDSGVSAWVLLLQRTHGKNTRCIRPKGWPRVLRLYRCQVRYATYLPKVHHTLRCRAAWLSAIGLRRQHRSAGLL